MNFGKDSEQTKGSPKNNNPLNLPYSDSEEEKEKTEIQGDEQAEQVVEGYPNLPSPTPPDKQNQPLEEASTSRMKPTRFQNINRLLRRVYDLEIFEKRLKREMLT